jgi:hypothetical protein
VKNALSTANFGGAKNIQNWVSQKYNNKKPDIADLFRYHCDLYRKWLRKNRATTNDDKAHKVNCLAVLRKRIIDFSFV